MPPTTTPALGTGSSSPVSITPAMLKRFDIPGPRYTSYPTADRFVEAFTRDDYLAALRQPRMGVVKPISLYIHIPFCESLCYYCACNKIVTRHHERATHYLRYLEREIALHVAELGEKRPVSQLHLGGGTPTFFSDAELGELMAMLRRSFSLAEEGEFAIEVDPRTVDADRLRELFRLGFNRLSFGVQDFNETVQVAVHRIQPYGQVKDLISAAREIGFQSMNVDLIYGLPKQTEQSFRKTVAQVCELRPDRIALYAYAHLPERFKPQRRILAEDLPQAANKVEMLANSIAALLEAGYVYVGMDHFALPDDALAVAKRQGRLHRNFQGYSTQPDCDLVALGVSAIGRIGATYSQNAKTLEEYCDLLDQGYLPIVRGLALTRDDVLRRAVITSVMCQGRVDIEAVESAYLIDFKTYFASELVALKSLADQGLVLISPSSLEVTEMGWYFVRAIAMTFDRYLQADRNRSRFSRII